jgi:hypothetical protein
LGRPRCAGTLKVMTLLPGDPEGGHKSLVSRLVDLTGGTGLVDRDPQQVIPPEQRRAAMSQLDRTEHKFALIGLVLGTLGGIAASLYIVSQHRVTKTGKTTFADGPDAWLILAAILIFCVVGFIALRKRKRTLVTFSLFLTGFAFTVFIPAVGLLWIALGGWLMLRAWRINKYGSTNAKIVAKEAAASRASGRNRTKREPARSGAKSATKSTSSPGERRPPTANKRYTPKSPPRKKIPKPTE